VPALFQRLLPRDRWVALAGVATILLCGVFVVGTTGDEEYFRWPILTAWLVARRGWLSGAAFWTPLLGLGAPQPFIPSFAYHPLAPLLVWMEPIPWLRVLLVALTTTGATGMWRLGAVLGQPRAVRAVGVVTFLLSAPVLNYALIDLNPSIYAGWAAFPWLVAMMLSVLDPDARHVRRWAAGLGLLAGITAASAHPGNLPVYIPAVAMVLLFAWKMCIRRAGWIAVAVMIAAAIASPVIVQLVVEARSFAPDLDQVRELDAMPLRGLLVALAHPLVPEPGMRSLFFGGPYLILAAVGCVWCARTQPGFVLGFVVSAFLLFTEAVPLPLTSTRYQIRDAVTFLGIVIAGLAVTRLLSTPSRRIVGRTALTLQLLVVAAAAAPILARHVDREHREAAVYRGAIADTSLFRTLTGQTTSPGRLLYAPRLSGDVAERALVVDGLGINSPAYQGVAVVNGSFKGVSTDTVSPDAYTFYGRVDSSEQLLQSDVSLDVLAVRYVLAYPDETVASGLTRRQTLTTARGAAIVFYENRDAWPTAFLVNPAVEASSLPTLPGCPHDRILCRDFAAVVASRDPAPLDVSRTADDIRVTRPSRGSPALLVVSEMFRPSWNAAVDGQPVPVRAVFGGLIGVSLPAGTRQITLRYEPPAGRLVQSVAAAGVLAGLCLLAWPEAPRSRKRRAQLGQRGAEHLDDVEARVADDRRDHAAAP